MKSRTTYASKPPKYSHVSYIIFWSPGPPSRRTCQRSALINQRAGVAKRQTSRKLASSTYVRISSAVDALVPASSIEGGTWSRSRRRRPGAGVWERRGVLSRSLMTSCVRLCHTNKSQTQRTEESSRKGKKKHTCMDSCI